jgi:hypothetical protein
MSFRTNPDRILANIDRARDREAEAREDFMRQAVGRELETELPDMDATTTERVRRIFKLVERAYMTTAGSRELRQLAQRFQSIGDIPHHHARGDVTVAIHYIDSDRHDDIGMSPFEIYPDRLAEEKKVTKTTRPDVNALRVLRAELRSGVMAAFEKIQPRVREAVRERADIGHVSAQVTVDLRPAE